MEPIRCAKEEMKPDGTKEGATEERTLDIHYFGTKVAKLILVIFTSLFGVFRLKCTMYVYVF